MVPSSERVDKAKDEVASIGGKASSSSRTAWAVTSDESACAAGPGDAAASAETPAPKERRSKMAPQWQWLHDRHGFRNYEKADSDRIEAHFQKGAWMLRMKSGTGRHLRPREIYFYDMLQYDPVSQKSREVRRVPEMHQVERLARRVVTMISGFMRGEAKWWKVKTLADFQEMRKAAADGRGDWIPDTQDLECFAGRIVNTWWFSTVSVLMIILNSFYIWIDADYNNGLTISDTQPFFIVCDNIFCVWFLVELILRFMAFKFKRNALRDMWVILDIVLVSLMILETWIFQFLIYCIFGEVHNGHLEKLSIFRACRLLRLARITRLFKVFPQLFILVKGMFKALRSLFYTLLLLFVLTYSFAIVFKYMSAYSEGLVEQKYDSVGGAMWNLVIYGTFLDSVGAMLDSLKEAHICYALFFIVYIFISNLTMLNMLIGILCEVLTSVSAEETGKLEKRALEESLLDLLRCYDLEEDQTLTRPEFDALLDNAEFITILEEYAVDVGDVEQLRDVLFTHKKALDHTSGYSDLKFTVLIDKILQLRGGNTATVNDMVELRNWLKPGFSDLAGMVMPAAVAEQCNLRQAAQAPPLDLARVGSPEALPPEKFSVVAPTTQGHPSSGFQQAVLDKLAAIRACQERVDFELSRMQAEIKELKENVVIDCR